jgi:hypothetical protein
MRRLVRRGLSWIAVAIALSACGGGSEEPVPPRFTAAMVQGKTFYREVVTPPADQEKMLITFSSATAVTLWQEMPAGVAEIPGTWSIDANGKLILQSGLGSITVTLVADAATYLDATGDDGTGPNATRLYKTIPFGSAFPDRFAVADRDLAGVSSNAGIVDLGTATGVLTDGFSDDTFTWSEDVAGVVTISSATEDNVLHLVAESSVTSSPKSLRVVGRRHDAVTTDFTGILDAVLTATPAKSGFTTNLVNGKVGYRESTGNRSIIRYDAGGVREEWYEDTVAPAYRVGTWQLTPLSGSLVALPETGLSEVAAMLIEDLPTRLRLLVNTGTPGNPVINPATLTKTVTANPASVPGVWSATEHLPDGTIDPLGTITLNGDGSGTGPSAPPEALHWSVEADGSILISFDGTTDTITFFALATSVLPSRLELAGAWYTGSTFAWTTVLTLTK